ncbi:MAG: hypothetical protein ACOCXH_09780 [Cyclobacteriaceae bacterium]
MKKYVIIILLLLIVSTNCYSQNNDYMFSADTDSFKKYLERNIFRDESVRETALDYLESTKLPLQTTAILKISKGSLDDVSFTAYNTDVINTLIKNLLMNSRSTWNSSENSYTLVVPIFLINDDKLKISYVFKNEEYVDAYIEIVYNYSNQIYSNSISYPHISLIYYKEIH